MPFGVLEWFGERSRRSLSVNSRTGVALPRRQAGLTLVEVLVAAVILAVGVIGTAMLQIQGLRSGQAAGNGLTAGVLGNQLAELIRLNSTNAPDYVGLTSSACPAPTPATLATQYRTDFCAVYGAVTGRYQAHSSNPAVSVSCLNCPNAVPRYRVTISWAEMTQTGSLGDNAYSVDFILPDG